ncbi:glycosyltransferase [Bacillus inaquosorum]|uniref:glycosyltransferase n=1 Tax=Bacillus inaquosorum TaxID=483913 RepID=UPI000A117A7A|nr:glycosyltransferase [Bacillus inaquosorum]QJC90341.1 Glycosyltransferase, EpsH like [Bacillus subtilis]WNW22844.1 glycosyltransferase [Bacillus inaquosorum]
MEDKNYKLSVVVLVYNTENYLRECLDSLINQTLKDIQIIIVNDESPDNSLEIIKEYQKNYSNIVLIDQKNSGGAIAGNNGLTKATGEYVTIIDSDDIVPLYAYEKLYTEAKEKDSDIVIGKPNILIDGIQKEIIYKKEREVWQEPKVINNLHDFLDIFYDGFYWNKIFRRSLIEDYNCFMPPGMLYADRPMVHKAFLYANKISIITDIVYLWRKRGKEASQKSITQLNGDIQNFIDRIESLKYQMNYFQTYGDNTLTNEFLKRNIERLFFPIKNIVTNKEFRKAFYKEIKPILEKIEDIYNNDIGIINNLYVYLILNDLKEELIYYLSTPPQGKVIGENGKFYWALPFFRDRDLNIPDCIFEIKTLKEEFVKIKGIDVTEEYLSFNEIKVPKSFSDIELSVSFESRFNPEDKRIFDIPTDNSNIFNGKIPLSSFDNLAVYDIYLLFTNGKTLDKFRISNKMVQSISFGNNKTARNYNLYYTDKNKLSLNILKFNIVSFMFTNEKITLKLDKDLEGEGNFYLKNRSNNDKVYFKKNKNESNSYEILWDHFFDPYLVYDLFFNSAEKNIRIKNEMVLQFRTPTLKKGKVNIEHYITNKGNVSLKSYSIYSKFISKILNR